MLQVQDLKLFQQIVRTGNISMAARQFDLTPAAASAALKRLEQHLGATLLVRSTRSLKLTPAGEHFLQHCQNALQALALGEQALRQLDSHISGELRLTAPSDLGRNVLLPWLDEFQTLYPALSLRLELGDKVAGLYREQVDLALRYGAVADSSHVAFAIAKAPRWVCAAPAYLQQFGEPLEPIQLSQHNCVLYQIDERAYDKWLFSKDGAEQAVNVSGNRVSNDADAVRRWIVNGKGIGLKSAFDMAADVLEGRVQVLLPQYQIKALQLNLICASRAQVTPAVLMLRDFLRQKFALLSQRLAEQGFGLPADEALE